MEVVKSLEILLFRFKSVFNSKFIIKVLMEVDKSLSVLIGNSVCAAMVVAYAGRLRQNERKMAFEKWRKICDSFKIQVFFIILNTITALKFRFLIILKHFDSGISWI